MRHLLVALSTLSILLASLAPAHAQISVGIALPGIRIGINMPVYPELVRVPGYPVYYAPRANSNYFFYDGLYWVYQGDNWYASSWYNGPWQLTGPEYVPLFVLRVPVRYYRQPPAYFHGWRADAPPRWGEHWGRDWEQRRRGWDQWDHRSTPAAAPLPVYQRGYPGDRYPRAEEQQHAIRVEKYRYQPRETVTQQYFQHGGHADSARAEPHQQQQQQQQQQHPTQPPPQVQRSSTESRDTGHENAHAQQGKGSEQKKHEERGQDH
jgi:hypothetical protein